MHLFCLLFHFFLGGEGVVLVFYRFILKVTYFLVKQENYAVHPFDKDVPVPSLIV